MKIKDAPKIVKPETSNQKISDNEKNIIGGSKLPDFKQIDEIHKLESPEKGLEDSVIQGELPEDFSGSFDEFVKETTKLKFNPEHFFINKIERKSKDHQHEQQVAIYSIIQELFSQYPNLERASVFAKIKSLDKVGNGFIDKENWLSLFGGSTKTENSKNSGNIQNSIEK